MQTFAALAAEWIVLVFIAGAGLIILWKLYNGTIPLEGLLSEPATASASSDDAGGVFGSEGEGLPFVARGASPIFPRVHLFGDDIRLFADATREQLCLFKNRRANLVKIVDAEHVTNRCLDKIPQRRFWRQQIASSTDSFDHRF